MVRQMIILGFYFARLYQPHVIVSGESVGIVASRMNSHIAKDGSLQLRFWMITFNSIGARIVTETNRPLLYFDLEKRDGKPVVRTKAGRSKVPRPGDIAGFHAYSPTRMPRVFGAMDVIDLKDYFELKKGEEYRVHSHILIWLNGDVAPRLVRD